MSIRFTLSAVIALSLTVVTAASPSPCIPIRCSDATRPTFAALVNGALNAVNEVSFTAAVANNEEDSEAWMNIEEADVDRIMEDRSNILRNSGTVAADTMLVDEQPTAPGATETGAGDPAVEAAADRLERLARKVESFVDGRGDMEGALFEE